jgi:hypothetical protein
LSDEFDPGRAAGIARRGDNDAVDEGAGCLQGVRGIPVSQRLFKPGNTLAIDLG